jgi:hypothetical protein
MLSKCYWCVENSKPGSVPNPVGIIREPLCTCLICQVFSCGHHAVRHKNSSQYVCWKCLYIKLVEREIEPVTQEDKERLPDWDPLFAHLIDRITDHYTERQESQPS